LGCGAYGAYANPDCPDTIEGHTYSLEQAYTNLLATYPLFTYKTFLLDLDGNCKLIHEYLQPNFQVPDVLLESPDQNFYSNTYGTSKKGWILFWIFLAFSIILLTKLNF
jgi:hypothetical protein